MDNQAQIPRFPLTEQLSSFQEEVKKGGDCLIEQLWDTPKAALASLILQASGKRLLIISGGAREDRLQEDLAYFFEGQVLSFPAWETLPSEQILPSPDIVGDRYLILQKLLKKPQPLILLTNLQACLQKVISPKLLKLLAKEIKVGDELDFDQLISDLIAMGYARRPVATDKGEFAVRGGLLDIYPVSSPDPFRIEFWGDEVESIRRYDPIGQKSIEKVIKINLTPAQELELLKEQTELATLIDYLGPNTIVVMDDLLALEDRYVGLKSIPGALSRSFMSFEAFLDEIAAFQKFFLVKSTLEQLTEVQTLSSKGQGYGARTRFTQIAFEFFQKKINATRWKHPFERLGSFFLPEEDIGDEVHAEELFQGISALSSTALKLDFLCISETDEQGLKKRLVDEEVYLPEETRFLRGYLSTGFALKEANWAIIPLAEITHRYKIRRQKQRSTYHTPPSQLLELTPGDHVVHLHHGVGKYIGLERKPNHLGVETEFLIIEYADKSRLLVPLSQTHLVSKYIGAHEEIPKLHAIGSGRWKALKSKTESAIVGYASDLIQLYANRQVSTGFSFPLDGPEMELFENDFPYVETEDQLAAIAAIKGDMTSEKVMDRLVCGDVGYGKTEVAIRAAFKAVEGKKQVAVLVPTTVLAMQHYETFAERMANFAITVDVLSRFRSAKEIAATLKAVKEGKVDILVGTHRVISKDVQFKDLGLIIIDEEQRFGVRAKEHLKTVKSGVDCLTMTATPIPRTLYMSLIGARDMSVISTPPQDRLPIKTIICETEDSILQQALLRELSRDGQAYVIHNRVESIYSFADKIKTLLPQARVMAAHGQMSSDELDTVFHAFKQGRIDILVATTIVENGIDIPNANTILIDRADQFGMADLYQLRGRVGRWNKRAYCYFLTPLRRALPEVAKKRLDALAEASGFGGGMRIAMRDLEIRGAGDLLGLEQSGHISAIGFHLYCKLLKRAIEAIQGKAPPAMVETKMEFPQDARLPEAYVNETTLRMEVYQRLGEATSLEEVDLLFTEIEDRFGKAPEPALWLFQLSRIRVYASRHGCTLLKLNKATLSLEQRKGDKVVSRSFPFLAPAKAELFGKKVLELLEKQLN